LLIGHVCFVGCGGIEGSGEPTNTPGPTSTTELKKGQSSFVYTKDLKNYRSGSGAEHTLSEMTSADAGSSIADSGPSTPADGGPVDEPPDTPPSGRTDEVEEGELYRLSGHHLFYLNTYRGLQVISLADPKKPKHLARLPIYGYPIEMFFEKDRAYVLVRDSLYLRKYNGKFEFEKRYVSQLLIVDIKDISNPKILRRFDILGKLREGVSRKVGKTIYVVSYQAPDYYWGWRRPTQKDTKDRATVYSFDVTDPSNVKKIQSLELIDTNRLPDNSSKHRYTFRGINITATSNALMVAENWSYYGSDENGCGRSQFYNTTVLNLIDISDPTGKIRVHTRFHVRGSIGDQFKQTYVYDPKTKRGIYYGIFARNERGTSCDRWSRVVKNTLLSIDISDGQKPQVLDTLEFGKPNETVRGSLFDHNRKVLYAITAIQAVDPLYAIDFSDPKDLKILSDIDGLSGDVNVFRLVGGGQYLLGVGLDNSGHCTGFDTSGWRATKVAVSLFDVRKLDKIRLIQRRCVNVQSNWVSSDVNWNRDQAHKMLGMYSHRGLNFVSVPVTYYANIRHTDYWWYHWQTSVGLMQWDLSKYDESKDEKSQKVLTDLKTIHHPYGEVKRTLIFDMKHSEQTRRYVLNISDTHMTVTDLEDPQQPKLLSSLGLTTYAAGTYSFGKYVVEHVSYSKKKDNNLFRIKRQAKGGMESWPEIASFQMGRVFGVVKWKQYLVIARAILDWDRSERYRYPYYKRDMTEFLVYDMRDPSKPKRVSSTKIEYRYGSFYSRYGLSCPTCSDARSLNTYGNTSISWQTTAHGLVHLQSSYRYSINYRYKFDYKVLTLDLRTPSKPVLKELVASKGSDTTYLGLVKQSDTSFWLETRLTKGQETETSIVQEHRHYITSLTFGSGDAVIGTPVNVPGYFVHTHQSGKKTYLYTWDNQAQPDCPADRHGYCPPKVRLIRLELTGDKAFARQWHTLKELPEKLVFRGESMVYLSLHGEYDKWGYHANPRLHLAVFGEDGFVSLKDFALPFTRMDLLGMKGNHLMADIGDGLMIFNLAKMSAPEPTHFLRLRGYNGHVSFMNDNVLVSDGQYGVFQLSLATPNLPTID
tara:strand:+ start:4799 stop:8083 length:3285 start_codon:yes stop_codon:yes gene_type:complete